MISHYPPLDLEAHRPALLAILQGVFNDPQPSRKNLEKLLRKHLKQTPEGAIFFANDELIQAYRAWAGTAGLPAFSTALLERLRLKPVRTASGVATLTVLTKPFPCPGECIFCPNDVRMPKSYLADEPGAQRAAQNGFDPYLQTYSRLLALHRTGHPTDKIELIILGGTWSFYPESYQIWFIRRMFDALHDFGAGHDAREAVQADLARESQFKPSLAPNPPNLLLVGETIGTAAGQSYNQAVQKLYQEEMARSRLAATEVGSGQRPRSLATEYATWDELAAAHQQNETAACRCVGLVVETRPDHVDAQEVLRLRRMGCTKVQIGLQSLDDAILTANKRGHSVAEARRAIGLLRRAGFKIHAHWMPNLYKATPASDLADYQRLFADPAICPDELKIYPCSLIASAELMRHYQAGAWQPYGNDDLIGLLAACFAQTPEYCRLTRVIRDIPGTDIVVGNKTTNLRQLVDAHLAAHGQHSHDIRAREVGNASLDSDTLCLEALPYTTSVGQEIFLQYITPQRQIAGFLRLFLPQPGGRALTADLEGAAIIREVHVYGQALSIGKSETGRAQHAGLGTALIEQAAQLATEAGYASLAVISAVGTRAYYRARRFNDGELYQVRALVGQA
jgi:elongator complex protein 3